MDLTTALRRIERMVAFDADPTLSSDELHELLDGARRPDRAGNLPTNAATTADWTAGTAYTPGTVVQQPSASRWWRCIVGGTSGATSPTWPSLGGLAATARRVTDGDVVWEDVGSEWAPTYDLNAAAAEGWRWKAAKASGRFGFQTDGQSFERQQVAARCLEMAATYERRAPGSSPTPPAR